MNWGDVVRACGRTIAGRPDSGEHLFLRKRAEIGVKFVGFVKFPKGFSGGRVLLVGFNGGELFSETGCY